MNCKLTSNSLRAEFQGRKVAASYFRLWHKTAILRRRVESYQVIDRGIVEKRRTYDLDMTALKGMSLLDRNLKKVDLSRPPFDDKVLIPTMKVPKELFSNVDTESGSGQALHLCRKHTNVQVVAHIIVGLCISFGINGPSGDNDGVLDCPEDKMVFDLAVEHLYSETDYTFEALRKSALLYGGASVQALDFFLADLETLFIQCVEIDLTDPACEFIKIRSTMGDDILEQKRGASVDATKPTKSGDEASLPKQTMTRERFLITAQEFCHSKISSLKSFLSVTLDLVGIKATRLVINDPPVGEGAHPTHMRIISPPGTLIDDVDIIRCSDNQLLTSHPKVGIFFRQDRAIIWDSGLSVGEYSVRVKVNPKRGSFLIPAAFGMFTQMILTVLCLSLGPASLGRNDASLGGVLLILPSFLAFFASRDTEHELLSRILGLPRLLTVLSAVAGVLCGALMFALPPESQNSHVRVWLFLSLLVTLYLSSTTFGLLIFQISRISLIRFLLDPVKRQFETKRSGQVRFSSERVECLGSIAFFVALFVLLMATLYIFPVTYLLEWFGSKWQIG